MNDLKTWHWRACVAAVVVALAQPLAAAAAEKSGVLFKCEDAAGVTSIQSDACPAGSRQLWKRSTAPEATPTAGQVAQAEAKRLADQQRVRELSELAERKLQAPPVTPAPRPELPPAEVSAEPAAQDACQSAQVFAASVREKTWLALSEDQVRRIYGWVGEQCKLASAKE